MGIWPPVEPPPAGTPPGPEPLPLDPPRFPPPGRVPPDPPEPELEPPDPPLPFVGLGFGLLAEEKLAAPWYPDAVTSFGTTVTVYVPLGLEKDTASDAEELDAELPTRLPPLY